jgi:hypothetical protein
MAIATYYDWHSINPDAPGGMVRGFDASDRFIFFFKELD